jgi:hypothetical protein
MPLLESNNVSDRRLRDTPQRFFGEESLMGCDDDIRKGEQARLEKNSS